MRFDVNRGSMFVAVRGMEIEITGLEYTLNTQKQLVDLIAHRASAAEGRTFIYAD